MGITFIKDLYIGKSVYKKRRMIKWKLKHFSSLLSLYVLIIPENENEQLEIMHAGFLRQRYYKQHPPLIAGFSGSYHEAVLMIKDLTDKALEETGSANIRAYILAKGLET